MRDYRSPFAYRGTAPKLHRNVATVTVNEEEVRMTRGERKRLFRQKAREVAAVQIAQPSLRDSKYMNRAERERVA
ncbi:MAG: hypothetical protein KGL39_56170 [Patescibacteria group bacterium]|nr:hypothetical protein [Patescibacteria group bacterium]